MNRTKTQTVQLSPDNPRVILQEVFYTPKDKWITIINGGCEISLSLENFEKLKDLVYSTVNDTVYIGDNNLGREEFSDLNPFEGNYYPT